VIDDPGPYRFTSTIDSPSGVRITVTTEIPAGHLSYVADKTLASDLSELTQVGANITAFRVSEAIKAHRERPPF
jgi:hypothetical protein